MEDFNMNYELLMMKLEKENIKIIKSDRIGRLDGLYVDGTIVMHPRLETSIEQKCILAEELGHHYTSHGDIRDQTKVQNRKQELKARRYGYKKLVPLHKLIKAYKYGCANRYETAQYLEITVDFLESAVTYYYQRYGLCTELGNYIIYFNPLGVLERL